MYKKENPDAPPRKRGRPRAANPCQHQKARQKRVKRIDETLGKITREASSKVAAVSVSRSQSWSEAFGTMPGHSLIGCLRTAGVRATGKNLLPGIAKHEPRRQMHEEVGIGACKMVKDGTIGPGLKQEITALLSTYVTDLTNFAAAVDCKVKSVMRARKSFAIAPCLKLKYGLSTITRSVYQQGDYLQLTKIVEIFFLRISNVRSGARVRKRGQFRELPMKHKDVAALWFVQFPELCREAAKTWPDWFRTVTNRVKRCRFENSVVAAVACTPATASDEGKERSDRAIQAHKAYYKVLNNNRSRWRGASLCNSKERNQTYNQRRAEYEAQELRMLEDLDRSNDQCSSEWTSETSAETIVKTESTVEGMMKNRPTPIIHVPTLKLVYKVLKGLHYSWSQNVYPTECPIHDEGSRTEAKLTAASHTAAASSDAWMAAEQRLREAEHETDRDPQKVLEAQTNARNARIDVAAKTLAVRLLTKEFDKFKRHCIQYDTCRAVIKQIESNLKPGEAVLYRDFVAQYLTGGSKLSNLVFVVLWHDGDSQGKFTHVMKFNHFCGDDETRKQDAFYTADVWDWFLGNGDGHSGFLSRHKICKLYVSGDHGPHFSSIKTMFNESTFFRRYNIELHLFFLCSYHAFNRCDAAGLESKLLHSFLQKSREALAMAIDVSDHLNASEYHNSVGVPLDKINRGERVFPVVLVEDENLDLRGKCEVKFHWVDADGAVCREDGVIFCRDIPVIPGSTSGALYEVYDLRKNPPSGLLCRYCSKVTQRPVRHPDVDCPKSLELEGVMAADRAKCIADGAPYSGRLNEYGVQLTPSILKNLQKVDGSHPCRVENCLGGQWYQNYWTANSHMVKKHGLFGDDSRLYDRPKVAKQRKRTGESKIVTSEPATLSNSVATTSTSTSSPKQRKSAEHKGATPSSIPASVAASRPKRHAKLTTYAESTSAGSEADESDEEYEDDKGSNTSSEDTSAPTTSSSSSSVISRAKRSTKPVGGPDATSTPEISKALHAFAGRCVALMTRPKNKVHLHVNCLCVTLTWVYTFSFIFVKW